MTSSSHSYQDIAILMINLELDSMKTFVVKQIFDHISSTLLASLVSAIPLILITSSLLIPLLDDTMNDVVTSTYQEEQLTCSLV